MFWSEELLASQFDSWLWLMQIFEAPTSSPQIHTFVTWISSRHANTQTTVNQRNNCCFSVICRTWHEKAVLGSLEKSALDQIFCWGKNSSNQVSLNFIQFIKYSNLLNHSKKCYKVTNLLMYNLSKRKVQRKVQLSAARWRPTPPRCCLQTPWAWSWSPKTRWRPANFKASQGYTFNRSLHCGANAGWNKGKSTIWIVFINNLYYLILMQHAFRSTSSLNQLCSFLKDLEVGWRWHWNSLSIPLFLQAKRGVHLR